MDESEEIGAHPEVFNQLSEEQLERLAILGEELSEVGKIIGKILRHGYESYDPTKKYSESNRQMLERELGDLSWIMELMQKLGDVSRKEISESYYRKAVNVRQYLHCQVNRDNA